jgi:hypothetical protein
MTQPVQVTCPSCQKLTWASPGVAIPCQFCHTPVNAPGAAAPAPAAAGPSVKVGGFSLPIGGAGGGGVSKVKIIGAAVLAAVLGIGGWFVKGKFFPKKGVVSYSSLGGKNPVADDLYKALSKDATKWKSDATFWSLNIFAVRPDGTVDTSQPVNIAYVSPSNSASSLKKTRSKSLRKYASTPSGMKSSFWGWNEPVKDLEPHPTPACSIKQLVGKLKAEGAIKGNVRVFFEPKFANFYAWTVFEGDAKPRDYSWENCEPIK